MAAAIGRDNGKGRASLSTMRQEWKNARKIKPLRVMHNFNASKHSD